MKPTSKQVAWLGLREIYTLIAHPDGQIIIKELLKKDRRPIELEKSVNKKNIYPLLKGLTLSQVIDRRVSKDRSVMYSISPFGRNVLELSEPLVDKIGKVFAGKKSILMEKK